jgi:hypothetical protein
MESEMTTLEKRVPLKDRGMTGEWSDFEARLFNLVSAECRRMEDAGQVEKFSLLFSGRLTIAQLMLDTFDEYFERKGKPQ